MGYKPQTFNDGLVKIYSVSNTAAAGEMPKEELTLKETLRFHDRTVGFSRFYAAKQASEKVDKLIRCPLVSSVSATDQAVIGTEQYQITLVQYPEDVKPDSMDLTLERLGTLYDIV
jgi:hypothetical protein